MKNKWRVGAAIVFLMLAAFGGEKLWAQKQDDTELLRVREQVWRAWFAGDTKTLEELVPAETIVMSGGEALWKHREDVLRTSSEFHAKGGKLLRLEFPRNEVQHFGDVAIVWSSYSLELEVDGKKSAETSRITEIFVKRNGKWVNPGWHSDEAK